MLATIRVAGIIFALAPFSSSLPQGVPGAITFSETSYAFPVPGVISLTQIAAGDVDGDGDDDFLIGHDKAYAYLGAGDGTFAAPIATSVGWGFHFLAPGDLDGDPCMDFVQTDFFQWRVWFSNCDGTFTGGQAWPLVLAPNDALVADFNGDGMNDFALNSYDLGLGSLSVYLALGGGTFASTPSLSAANHYDLVGGDLDQDGLPEVITDGSQANIYYAGPSGALCCKLSLSPLGIVTAAAIADFNKDGRADLALTKFSTSYGHYLDVFLEASSGGLVTPVYSPEPVTAAQMSSLYAADIDHDGRLDLVGHIGSGPLQSLVIARGTGDGSFSVGYSGLVGQAGSAALGDFNGDGRPDLAVLHATPALVTVLINRTVASAWFDLGQSLAGPSGRPLLSGSGSLAPGAATTLDLVHASPLSPTVLVVGGSELQLPILGGILVPSPDVLVFGLVTNGHGTLQFSFPWPGVLPPGTKRIFQTWTADVGVLLGWTASNGLSATVP